MNDEEWAVHDALFGTHPDASDSAQNANGAIANAWSRVVWDCGCPDVDGALVILPRPAH